MTRAASLVCLVCCSACKRENPGFLQGDDDTASVSEGGSATSLSTTIQGSEDGSSVGSTIGSATSASTSPTSSAETAATASTSADSTSETSVGTDTGDERIVFVTSAQFVGGELGGLDGADARCQELAQDAGLAGVFRAWLSDPTGSPSTRMTFSSGPYRLVDGTTIAISATDLLDGTLLHPIDTTEQGLPAPNSFICAGGEVWTNTDIDGQAMLADQHCGNWNATDAIGFAGNHQYADKGWTASECGFITCVSILPLYCFQQ